MQQKVLVPILIVLIIVVGAGAFYGGMVYGKGQTKSSGQQRFAQMGGNFAGGAGATRRGGAGTQGGGFVNGQILSNDGKTMTVKINTGGSKIIFLSDTSEVSKMASGTPSDLTVGQNIMVTGKTNTDGSVTASTIQIRPAMPVGANGVGGPNTGSGNQPAPVPVQ